MELRDLANQRFGDLLVLGRAAKPDGMVSSNAYWLVRCLYEGHGEVCNREVVMQMCNITARNSKLKTCGCSRYAQNLTSRTIGLLHVTGRATSTRQGRARWFTKCTACGVEKIAQHSNLMTLIRNGGDGCQCTNPRGRTHGKTGSPAYNSWVSAKARCTNPRATNYAMYGGSGVRMCDRWLNSFQHFLDDMGPRPNGCTLDRINPLGDYEPSNCRWANHSVQSNNRRIGLTKTVYIADLSPIDQAEIRALVEQKRMMATGVSDD
jgi:hypothetical protein